MLVDPTHLHCAAREHAEVGGFVAELTSGASAASSGAHLAGLASESACRFVGAALDTAATATHQALVSHAERLTTAATHYQRTDEEFGRRLRSFST